MHAVVSPTNRKSPARYPPFPLHQRAISWASAQTWHCCEWRVRRRGRRTDRLSQQSGRAKMIVVAKFRMNEVSSIDRDEFRP